MKLIALAGLPGSGKSSIAKQLALRTGAVWLRVDSMDQAIWASGTAPRDLLDWTYRAAQAVAIDNLSIGRDIIIADCVNNIQEVRDGWEKVGMRTGAEVKWLEIVCSDHTEHRKRVETRISDVVGLELPNWEAVVNRTFDDWDRDRAVIDTAHRTLGVCVAEAISILNLPDTTKSIAF